MKIFESFLTNNPCYIQEKKIKIKGLMLHSVGCSQPSAKVFISIWNRITCQVCVHAFIDANTGDAYQTLPWNYRGWHCGKGAKGSANNTHIGIEMCEPNCIKYIGGSKFTVADKDREKAKAMVKKTYASSVELFAKLCKENNLNPLADGVIISHSEGAKRGIASNHADPEHLWAQLDMQYTMDGFRKDVDKAMKKHENPSYLEPNKVLSGKPVVVDLKKGSKGENVKVLQKNLNTLIENKLINFTKLYVDGDFGNNTENCLKAFQRKYNLWVDGIYGTNSRERMTSVLDLLNQVHTVKKYDVKIEPLIGVNMRVNPDVKSKKIYAIPFNKVVTVTNENNGWGYVGYGAYKGWIKLSNTKRI